MTPVLALALVTRVDRGALADAGRRVAARTLPAALTRLAAVGHLVAPAVDDERVPRGERPEAVQRVGVERELETVGEPAGATALLPFRRRAELHVAGQVEAVANVPEQVGAADEVVHRDLAAHDQRHLRRHGRARLAEPLARRGSPQIGAPVGEPPDDLVLVDRTGAPQHLHEWADRVSGSLVAVQVQVHPPLAAREVVQHAPRYATVHGGSLRGRPSQ